MSKKIDVDKSEIKSYTSAACTCLGCISQEIKERIHVHGDVGNKDDSYMICMVARIFNYMLARLQLSTTILIGPGNSHPTKTKYLGR